MANAKVREFSIKWGFLIVMGILFVTFSILQPAFYSAGNLFNILLSVCIFGTMALGETFVLIIDGMDLSIGSTAAITVMISAYSMVVLQLSGVAAIVIVLLLGAAIGLFISFLIVKVKIPDLLATLGMMFLVQGLQLIPSGGLSIGTGAVLGNGKVAQGHFDEGFKYLGQGRVFKVIPIPVLIMIVIALLVYVILSRTKYGRVFYAIGGNPEAARLVGVNVNKYKVIAYVSSSIIASLAGILLAARVGRGDVGSQGTLLMDAIAAALIGYAVLGVRKPNPFGTILGAIFIGMLMNGLTMLSMQYFWQDFIKGSVLVAALAFTFGLSKKK